MVEGQLERILSKENGKLYSQNDPLNIQRD